MNNRGFDHFGNISTIFSGTCIFRVRGGEANLIIDHYADCSAYVVTSGTRHIQGFLYHTLTNHRTITMHRNWQYLAAFNIIQTFLTSTYRTNHHRRSEEHTSELQSRQY